MTTTFTVSAIVLISLCAPVFADSASPAPAQATLKIRFAVRDAGSTHTFDVVVAPERPCASASERKPDRQLELKACVARDSLDIEWSARTSSSTSTSEYQSTSSLKIVRGATTEIGSSDGPRLTVTIQ